MALLYQAKYPTGGRLLVFTTGKTKYEPSVKYKEMREAYSNNATRTSTRTQSTEKNVCEFIDRIYAAKAVVFPEDINIGKQRFLVIKKDRQNVKRDNAPIVPFRTRVGNFLRLATFR